MKQYLNKQGFTIIELLIAMAVFSTILVMVTFIMINIGSLYYKGINQTRVQDNARAITDELAHKLQLTSSQPPIGPVASTPSGKSQVICIGNVRYSFRLHKQIGLDPSTQTPHVLWRDTLTGSCTEGDAFLDSSAPSVGGTELIAPNSRLTAFSVSGNSPYDITVGVAYGDDDLLCNTSVASDCANTIGASHVANLAAPGTIRCAGQAGDQYCATAFLQTIAGQRLTNN